MHDEDGFLAAIRQTPTDDTARLVFADWLDEQDDSTAKLKAAFIRLELRMAESPEKSLNRVRLLNQLQKLAAQINPSWLAVVSHPKLEACRMSFRFECPQQWEKLTPLDEENVRFCGSCMRRVRFCTTLDDARFYANSGTCVALSPALVRKPDDLSQPNPTPGQSVRLTPEMIERLRVAAARGETVGFALPMYEPPPAPPAPQWVSGSEEYLNRKRVRARRRQRWRNIQRENWEEME